MNVLRMVRVSLFLLLMPFVLSGCWNRHELNEISIVVGLGIDKQGDNFKVSVQTVNPGQVAVKKGAGSNASPVIIYEDVGKTIPEALARMTVEAPRHLYFAHLRMVIIGEDAARAGISKTLDFLSRNMEMRTDFFFVVAKEATASEVLKVLSVMDPIPANNMYTKLETSDYYWAATGRMNLNDLLQDLVRVGKSPTMTGIEIVGNRKKGGSTSNGQHTEPPALLKYGGMVAFRLDRMVGWLDENETKAWNYVQNSIRQTTGVIPCPDGSGNISMQVIRSRTTIEASIRDGQPEFDVYVTLEQDVADVECKMDMTHAAIVNVLEKESNEKIQSIIEDSVKNVQKKYGTDIYGFGDVLHKYYPKEWRKIKNWNEKFKDVAIRAHVDTKVRRIGTILQPVKQITKY